MVVHLGISDCNASAVTNVESIGVVAAGSVTSAAVDDHVVDVEVVGIGDADRHQRRVQDVKVVDGRRLQAMSKEELGLRLALGKIGTIAIPPSRSVGVQRGTSTVNGDRRASDAEKRASPFLVAPGSSTLEDDLVAECEFPTKEVGVLR